MNLKLFPEAIHSLEKAILLSPNNEEVYNDLGLCLYHQ